MYSVEFKYYNEIETHRVDEFWDLQMDGNSVCGIDWWEQECKTVKFGCLADSWLEEHIINEASGRFYKGYLRILVYLIRDGATIFMGMIKANGYSVKPIQTATGEIKEMGIEVVDMACVLKDWGNEESISITAGVSYNIIEQIESGFRAIVDANSSGLTGLTGIDILSNYDTSQWTPFHVDDLPIFRRRDHDYPNSANGETTGLTVRNKVLKLSQDGDTIQLTYIDYWRYVTSVFVGDGQRRYDCHQKLKYGIWQLNGMSLAAVLPEQNAPLTDEWVDSDLFGTGSNINSDGQTVAEWVASLPTLLTSHNVNIEPGAQHEETSAPYQAYDIVNGVVFYTGFDAFTTVIAAEDKDMKIMDWITLLLNIASAFVEVTNNRLRICNKGAIYETSYIQLPSEMVGEISINPNYQEASEFAKDMSMIVNGDIYQEAINGYFSHLMRNDLRFMVEFRLDGQQTDLNVRYYYPGWMLYVISANYDVDKDETAIKALARNMAV